MKKSIIIIIFIILLFIISLLLMLPYIKITVDNKILYINYDGDISEFDKNHCYNESVAYNAERDISITSFKIEKHFIFYLITLDYENGNLCDSEYILEEEYINNFINNAIIEDNDKHIDVASLIEGKTAIVGNTRYLGNDYTNAIYYVLDGRYDVMYIFYKDDLLIFQVGSPDESSRFIAYR